jgi:hypothetical protein
MTVPTDYNVQACAAPNFLTYNPGNHTFICSSPSAINASCPSGQVLQGIVNSQAVCAAAPSGGGMANCSYMKYVVHHQMWNWPGPLSDTFYTVGPTDYSSMFLHYAGGANPVVDSTTLLTAESGEVVDAGNEYVYDIPQSTSSGAGSFTCINGHWVARGGGGTYTPPAPNDYGGGDGGGGAE